MAKVPYSDEWRTEPVPSSNGPPERRQGPTLHNRQITPIGSISVMRGQDSPGDHLAKR